MDKISIRGYDPLELECPYCGSTHVYSIGFLDGDIRAWIELFECKRCRKTFRVTFEAVILSVEKTG